MESKKNHLSESLEVESWLKNAAKAPEGSRRAAEQLNPLPPLEVKLTPERASSIMSADTPFLEPDHTSKRTQAPTQEPKERYQMEKEFARGGLGRILRAKDQKLDRTVAVKELLSPSAKMKERFLREAFITAKLEHPSIVPIHDIGVRPNGEPYYAMKLVDGRSFDKVIAEKATLAERLSLLPHLIDACKAIAYAHSKGVIHRDLKPHNILLGSFGETVVIDWGLAKELKNGEWGIGNGEKPEKTEGTEDKSSEAIPHSPFPIPYREEPAATALTQDGSVLGTPAYMSLEQAQGKPLDERTDVYSLGAILYHLLAGLHPYFNDRAKDTLLQVIAGPPRPLQDLVSGAPKELLSIVQKAMSRDVNERYPSAQEMLEELLRFQAGKLVGAHSYTTKELFTRWVMQHRMKLGASMLFLVAGMAAIGASYSRISKSEEKERLAKEQAQQNERLAKEEQQKALIAKNQETKAKQEAEQALAALLEEQGKRALLDGDPGKAAVYLKEAYLKYPSQKVSAALRYSLRAALQGLPLASREDVLDARFSLDAKKIFLVHTDNTIEILDASSYQTLSTFGEKREPFESPFTKSPVWALSAQGNRAATVSAEDNVALWDIEKAEKIATIWQPQTAQMKLTPDGSVLFTCSGEEGTWRAWDARGELLHEFPVTYILFDFSQDSRRAIFYEQNGNAYVVETNSGKEVFSFSGLLSGRPVVALSNDGNHLAALKYTDPTRVASGAQVELWDLNQKKLLAKLPQPASYDQQTSLLSFSPGGDRLVSFHKDSSFQLWSLSGEPLPEKLENKQNNTLQLRTFSEDGKRLFTLGGDGLFSIWDSQSGALLHRSHLALEDWFARTGAGVAQFRLAPDHTQLAALSHQKISFWSAGLPEGIFIGSSGKLDQKAQKAIIEDKQRLWVWDLNRRALTPLAFPQGEPQSTVFYINDEYLVGKQAQTLKLWDFNANLLQTFSDVDSDETQEQLSPNGQRLITTEMDGTIWLWSMGTGARIAVLQGASRNKHERVFSPNSAYLATSPAYFADVQGQVQVWNLSTGALVHTLKTNRSPVWKSFSHDSRYLVVAGGALPDANGKTDTSIQIWDLQTGQLAKTLESNHSANTVVGFSHDGSLLFSASTNKTLQLWDIKSNKILLTIGGFKGLIPQVEISPDDRLIATRSEDGAAKLWDVKTGALLLSAAHHFPDGKPAQITSIHFSQDGAWLFTVGEDGVLRSWSTQLETRSPKEVSSYVDARVFWKLEGGQLVRPTQQ